MKRGWWYVICISSWGFPFIYISDDPKLDWSTAMAEFEHYDDAHRFANWFDCMVER